MMKQLVLLLVALTFSGFSYAQITLVPDVWFENELILKGIDSDGTVNGQILTADAAGVTELEVQGGITDFTGIEAFTSLEKLTIGANATSIDVSMLSTLKWLYVGSAPLNSLNVTGLSNLEVLGCTGNTLNTLDLTGLNSLRKLDVVWSNMPSTALDLTGITTLDTLILSNNSFTSYTFPALPNLSYVDLGYNNLTSLDVSQLSALERLELSSNSNLNALDLSGLTNLAWVRAKGCGLTSLNLTNTPSLDILETTGNLLTTLDLSGAPNLTELKCQGSTLPALDCSGHTALLEVNVSESAQLANLNVAGCSNLQQLDAHECMLTTLNLTGATSLKELWIYNNKLTSLDVSILPSLETVSAGYNELTSLTFGPANYATLEGLGCNDNQLTALDCSNLTAFTTADTRNNQLNSFDLRGVNMTNVQDFYVSGNSNLSCIWVDDVAEANSVMNLLKDVHTNFNTDCSCPVTVAASSTGLTCAGGSDGTATASAQFGIAPYTYSWSNGATIAAPTGLGVGIYTVTVTDASSCTATTSTNVSTPGAVVPNTNAVDAGCSTNGSASAMPTGGTPPYTYSWSNGASTSTASSLPSATYTVTVTDNNGCTGTAQVLVGSGAASVPATQIQPADCGTTLNSMSDYVNCESVPGAQRYQFRIVEVATGTVKEYFSHPNTPTATYLSFALVSGAKLATEYTVQARCKVAGTWGCFGAPCTITTPATVQPTQLTPTSCNSTLAALNNYIYWNPVPGAERYGLEVTGPNSYSALAFSAANAPTGTFFALSNLPNIEYAQTYSVRIRTRVGGIWYSYGPACNVSTPANPPAPTIRPSFCGTTLNSISQYVTFLGVPGATRYQHEYYTASGTAIMITASPYYAPTTRHFSLQWILPQPNTTYRAAVRAKVGGVWQPFGPDCELTTPAAKRNALDNALTEDAPELLAMPNPTTGTSTVLLGADCADVRVTIRNMMGQVVSVQQFGTTSRFELTLDGAPGIYFVSVEADQGTVGTVKLIKK